MPPFVRNQFIVDYSDVLIAFVDKDAKGTWDTINKAKRKNIPVYICNVIEGIAGL